MTPAAAPPAPARPAALARTRSWLNALPPWRWRVLGLAAGLGLPLLFSRPDLPLSPDWTRHFRLHFEQVMQQKIDDLGFDYAAHYPSNTNEAKRNGRLLVPVVARLTGAGVTGVHVFCLVMQGVLMAALLLAGERAAGDRLAALAATLAVAGTSVGTAVWSDIALWCDNCAFAFITLALVIRRPLAAGVCLVLAMFVDERALLAVPLVILFHRFTASPRSTAWAAAATVPAYALLRLGLMQLPAGGLPLANVATRALVAHNLEVAPFGFWFALEGGWCLVVPALAALGGASQVRRALGVVAATVLPMTAALGVGDFSRSASYAFAATFVALAALRPAVAPDRLARFALVAAIVSLVVPNISVMTVVVAEPSPLAELLARWL